jgi:hypothetical protein
MGRQQPTWVVNLFVSEPLLKKTIELTVAQSKTYYVIAKKCSKEAKRDLVRVHLPSLKNYQYEST